MSCIRVKKEHNISKKNKKKIIILSFFIQKINKYSMATRTSGYGTGKVVEMTGINADVEQNPDGFIVEELVKNHTTELQEYHVGVLDDEDKITHERIHWGSETEFLLSCVGYAVGIGNIWRFPYLCFENGGGAFLIPYAVITLILGVPMFMLEIGIGQYYQLGPTKAWGAIHPSIRGIGFASCTVTFIVSLYYNVIIGWCLYYLYLSFFSEFPWNEKGSPAYFDEDVLRMSPSINEIGDIVPHLTICNFFGWIFIFFVVFKGVQSVGKVKKLDFYTIFTART